MRFNCLQQNMLPALKELSKEFGFDIADDGIKITFETSDVREIKVKKIEDTFVISASSKPHKLLGFSQLILKIENGFNTDFVINPFFHKNGMMIDNSRNAVVSVSMVKKLLRNMAYLGQNWYMLYMEDVYEIEEEPYFGYLRGRYSKKDLKELDDYANMFGIELIPCIQTLAHVNQFFAWQHESKKYCDIDDIFNVSRSSTLELIDKMIKNLSECFTTNLIHIGMDEAYNLGRGTYLDENGLKNKKDIMLEHLKNTLSICDKYDLKPIIWDDMFFSGYSNLQGDKKYQIPQGIELMYWDYYSSKKQHYIENIEKRRSIAGEVSFAGGAWRWTGYCPHHIKTLNTTIKSLSACREKGVKKVIATSWSDDGSEAPFYASLFGMVLFSFLDLYEKYDEKLFDIWLKYYTDMDLKQWLFQGEFDRLGEEVDDATLDITPSKYFFYQDVLMSQFEYYCNTVKDDYDAKLDNLIDEFSNMKGGQTLINDFYLQYAKCLKLKWKLPVEVLKLYNNNDKGGLEKLILQKIEPLEVELEKFIQLRRRIWLKECNPQGLEVLEQRVGGLIYRLKTTKQRLYSYINGEIKVIEELEEPRIDPCPSLHKNSGQGVHYNGSLRIMSVSKSIW